jgi:ribosome-associated protein
VKALDVVALDVTAQFPLADVFVIASGTSERQVVAIAERVEEELAKVGARAARREGVRRGRWALLDFSDIIVHVMHEDDRAYYDLERLWKDCPVVPLPEDAPAGDAV